MPSPVKPERPVTLSVFMEGTSNPMEPVTTQIALFAQVCKAEILDPQKCQLPDAKAGHYKLCFDGCGVTNGFWGVLIAAGLQEQCTLICEYVRRFVEAGLPVTINFVGASRGGIGGLYLAQELTRGHDVAVGLTSEPDVADVLLNLLLIDPVPGDFVWISRYLDVLGKSNANKAMDISHVRNLGRVIVLYPHEPLPSIAVHAPLIPTFPADCAPEWDVVLGCHQGAMFLKPSAVTCFTFARIRDFLDSVGSKINVRGHELHLTDALLEDVLSRELDHVEPTSRFAHASTTGWDIVRHPQGQFLCRGHRELLKKMGQEYESHAKLPLYMLDFQQTTSEGTVLVPRSSKGQKPK